MSTVRERLERMKSENRPLTSGTGEGGGTPRQVPGLRENVRARLEKVKQENKTLTPVSASSAGSNDLLRRTAIERVTQHGKSGMLPLSPYGQAAARAALERAAAQRAAEQQESVADITAKRDAAGMDAEKAKATLQAAQAGGWLPGSGMAERVTGSMETLQRSQQEQNRQGARLKERAEQAQRMVQTARIQGLASEETLQERRDSAGMERTQAEARAAAMMANPLTANMSEYAALRETADRAGAEESRAKSDLALRRSVYVNEKEKAAAAALVKAAPVGMSVEPDYESARTPEQKRATSTVRAILKPDAAAAPAAAGDAEGVWNALRVSMLTEEEKRAVLSYAAAGSWDKAAELLGNLERILDERQQGQASAIMREAARENPFAGALMNAVSTYAQPYAYLEGLKQTVHNLATGEDEPINQNGFWMSGAHMTQDTAAGVVQGVNESIIGDIFGDVSFVTETGLSILQNIVRYPMKAASLPFMAVGAAGGGTLEGAQQGLSAGEAVALGTAAGLAEYVTEKVSLESLLDTVKAGATPLRRTLFNIGKQIVAEGSEEAASEYLNLLADAIIRGDRNEMTQYSRDLQAQGFSKSEADAMAITQYMVEAPALSALGGALSGGMMGTGGAVFGNALGRFKQWKSAGQQKAASTGEAGGLTPYSAQKEKFPTTTAATSRGDNVQNGNGSTSLTSPIIADEAAGGKRQFAQADENDALNYRGLARAAGALGEHGAKAAEAAYDGQTATDVYYGGFAAYYEAGVQGSPMERVSNPYGEALTEAQRYAAYVAGQNDAKASLEREKRAAGFAATVGTESGLVYDDYTDTALEHGTAEKVNQTAKLLGVRVRFVDSVRDGTANAQIKGGEVLIEKGNQNPVMFLVGHEMTHRMQELAPEAYRAFREYVAEQVQGEAHVLQEQYMEQGESLNYEGALDEAAANYAGRMIENGNVLDAFIEKHRSDRTFLEKVRDALRIIIAKLTGTEKRKAQSAEGKLTAALEAAAEQVETLNVLKENAATEDGGARYSIDPAFAKNIEEWDADGRPSGERFTLGSTGAVLQGLGAIESDIYMEGDKISTILSTHEEMTLEEVKRIPELLDDPVLILKSKGTGKRGNNSRLVVFGTIKAQNGQPIMAVLDLRPRSDGFLLNNMQKVNSAYTKNNAAGFIESSEVMHADKKRTIPLLRQFGLTIASRQLLQNGSIGSISYDGGTVNISGVPFSAVVSTEEDNVRFSMKAPVEETKTLIALHNLTEDKLIKSLNLGGFPMPSIAVTRANIPHTNFGDITLVMNKSTIDPKTDRRNMVYSADAWTPTFPATEYEADARVIGKLRNKFYELQSKFGREAVDALYAWGNYAEEQLNREGGEASVLEKLRDNTDMMKVYLLDNEMQVPEKIMTETVTRLDDAKIEQYNYLIEKLGKSVIDEMEPANDESPTSARRRWIDAHGEQLEEIYRGYLKDIGGLPEAEIDNVMENPSFSANALLREVVAARRYLANGPETRTTTVNTTATRQAIREATDQEAYRAWLDDMFGGIEKSSGVYNGKGRYTNSGNLRSFKATHLPVTLDNIAKAMVAEGKGDNRNVTGFHGVKTLRATMAERFSSIADMHKLEGRLQQMTEEEAEQITDTLQERLYNLLEHIYNTKSHSENSNKFIALDNIGEILMEASRAKTITVDSIMKAYSDTGYKVGTPLATKLRELLFDIAQMPVNIFEAKPERSVRFDEVITAVIPDNASDTLKKRLASAGVQILEYTAGDDNARLKQVNSVEGATFSLKGSENAGDIAALLEENKRLRGQLEHYRGKAWRGDGSTDTLMKKDVDKLGRRLLKSYDSTLKVNDISGKLMEIGETIVRGGEGLTWQGVREKALSLGREIVESAVVKDDEMYRQYSGLRQYLRDTKIQVPSSLHGDLAQYGGYAVFRKANMGRLNLSVASGTPVDVAFHELAGIYPEWFSEKDTNNPADMLARMAEVREAMKVVYENPYSYDMASATEHVANEILDGLMSRDVRQVPATQEGWAKAVKYVERERDRQAKAVKDLKDHYSEMRRRQVERRTDSEARTRLLKIARRLQNKKLPSANRALVEQYIGELDTASKSLTGRKLADLTALRDWYEAKFDENSPDYNPDFLRDPVIEADLKRLSKRQINDLTASEVADLTNILLNIEHELTTSKKLLDSEDRRDVYLMGMEVIKNIQGSGGSAASGPLAVLDKFFISETLSPVRQIRRMTGHVDSDPLYKATLKLADGQRRMLDYQMNAERPFEKFAEDKKFRQWFSGAKAGSIKVTGFGPEGPVEVEISPAMRVSLYLHSLNDQNLRHIRDGGITVPDAALYRKGKLTEAYARGVTVKLSPSQVRSITAGMTEQERDFARMAKKYFNETSKTVINETSVKLKGYELAQVENYYPINTDNRFTRSEFETLKRDGTIEGMGYLKERVTRAHNPIMLRDANAVLEQSIQMHGKYVGLAVPVRNFNKIWNVTASSYDEDGNKVSYTGSVKRSVEQTWGKTGSAYIEKLMTDLQAGHAPTKAWSKALSKVRSNYAGAVLTLNLSVAMKQAASYPTAAAVLGWGPLMRAMGDFGKVDLKLIERYTPLQWYRSKGFSSKELGDLAARGIPLPAALNWVQGADLLTTRKLWKASEYYVRSHSKELAHGTDAYYRAVADVYNRVIEETQPNYTTMQRPQLLRSDDSLMANLAMFKTQPFQNFNILYDAAGNLLAKTRQAQNGGEQERAAVQEARRSFGLAVSSQLVQLAVFAGMTAAWAFFRGRRKKYEDEDGEVTAASFMKALGKDMIGGAASVVPFGSDAWEVVSSLTSGDTYYGMDAVTVSAVADTVTSVVGLYNLVKDGIEAVQEGEEVSPKGIALAVDGYADKISKALGVPYENVANLYNATYRRICIASMGEYMGEYQALRATADPKKRSGDYFALLYKAMKNSPEDYEKLRTRMIEDNELVSDSQTTEERLDAAMKRLYRNEVKKTEEYKARYGELADELGAFDSYQEMSGQDRNRLLGLAADMVLAELTAQDYEGRFASDDKWTAWASGGEAYGVTEAEAMLFKAAYSMAESDKDANGESVSGSKKENTLELAAELLGGMTKREQDYLSSYFWTPTDGKLKKLKENGYQ